MKMTSWNTVCRAAQALEINAEGFNPIAEDFDVLLQPLEDFPDWLEVARPDGDTMYYLPSGEGTALSYWIVPWPSRDVRDREGIAVPDSILEHL